MGKTTSQYTTEDESLGEIARRPLVVAASLRRQGCRIEPGEKPRSTDAVTHRLGSPRAVEGSELTSLQADRSGCGGRPRNPTLERVGNGPVLCR